MNFSTLAAMTVRRPMLTTESVCAAGGCTAHAIGSGMPVDPALSPPGTVYGMLSGIRPYCADHGRHSVAFR